MTRKLAISFGGKHHAEVTKTRHLEWRDFCAWLVKEPPEADSKEERGWYCGAEFFEDYRHSDNFVARHVLTLDFDHVDVFAFDAMAEAFKNYAFAQYTTFSHTDEKPRFRIVLPLDRPAGFDEFQAVSRKICEQIGIELAAGESHVPAQFMFAPLRPRGGIHRANYNATGPWINVDAVLAQYEDWTDRDSWPRRKVGDRPTDLENRTSPLDKPGIIGQFCRAYTVSEAIEKFDLPYVPTNVEGRWTYTGGSRPEGAIIYDDDTKLHSHHDTDPARGQSNAFDLVRAHRFHALDAETGDCAITDRPSYKAMCDFARALPEVRDAIDESVAEGFEDLGPLTEEQELGESPQVGAVALARRIADVLRNPTSPRWLIRDELERGVIAVMAGPRGSYKSFIALDWAMRCATNTNMGHPVDAQHPVYVVSAEGGDFDRRARAWLQHFRPDLAFEDVPLYVVERRIDLDNTSGIEAVRKDCLVLSVRPVLFVLDTFSKLSGGLDENDNTAVKQFIGRIDNGLKRKETGFDATVLLVCHTGHSDAGRPRGASALAADTDAEYIVARNEGAASVSITRERFKASPELPPLTYKPMVVDLGYTDIDGNEVTSLVMKPAEPPKTGNGRIQLRGANQTLIYDTMKELSADGDDVKYVVLVERARDKLPNGDGSKDRRRDNLKKAVDDLIAKKVLFLHGGNCISLTDVASATDEDWLA